MTEDDPVRDTPLGKEQKPAAAIHQQLSATGIAINEAHSYLSVVRTLDGDTKDDLYVAEIEAMHDTLQNAHEQLEDTIKQVDSLKQDVRKMNPSDGHKKGEESAEILWNMNKRLWVENCR